MPDPGEATTIREALHYFLGEDMELPAQDVFSAAADALDLLLAKLADLEEILLANADAIDDLTERLADAERERDKNERFGNEWGEEAATWHRRVVALEEALRDWRDGDMVDGSPCWCEFHLHPTSGEHTDDCEKARALLCASGGAA